MELPGPIRGHRTAQRDGIGQFGQFASGFREGGQSRADQRHFRSHLLRQGCLDHSNDGPFPHSRGFQGGIAQLLE